MNIPMILQADSYKYSHYELFPKGTIMNNSYIEARGWDKSFWHTEPELVVFGLQAFIMEHLTKPITHEDVDKAKRLLTLHGLPFNEDQWRRIVDEMKGLLPISITAVPEGTVVKLGEPIVQVQNTHVDYAWLASFVETSILRAVWYPSTVATLSREVKIIIKKYLNISSDNVESELPFKLHDFGGRGVSSSESAQLGGLAHLISFQGTDTVEALVAAEEYYDAGRFAPYIAGFSVPASEHSTITSWGKEAEYDAFANMVDKFKGRGGIISCVSDSYDIYKAVNEYWPKLKDEIVKSGSTLVVRPDSGDPEVVLPIILKSLSESFGSSVNSKGFKVLENVRVLWGDGIDLQSIPRILATIIEHGFSTENIVLGMGGGLLQKVNRDTLKFAMKTSAIHVKGEKGNRDVFKCPITDDKKASKKGIQVLKNARVVFENGVKLWHTDLPSIRERAEVK